LCPKIFFPLNSREMAGERSLFRDWSVVSSIGGGAAHDDNFPGLRGTCGEEGLDEVQRRRRETPDEMSGDRNGTPGFRSGKVKKNPMFWDNL
jgi:hypothetical protein